MKCRILMGILAVGLTWPSRGENPTTFIFTNGFANGGLIEDGTPGWSDTRSISGIGANIADVNVFLHLSGGYNGDLYGYLVHETGFAVLLNRVGRTSGQPFGYSDAGMNIKFDDAASNGDIHYYQLVSGYGTSLFDGSSWAPDGRNVDPTTVDGTEARTSLLADFNGLSADGSWTLFLTDLSVGEESTVIRWGLEVTAVPEPAAWALMVLGGLGLAGWQRSHRRAR